MKSATPALVTYLNGLRPTSDAPLQAGDLFTIWLANGSILTYTDLDLPVAWNGYVYSASSVLVSGLRYKGSLGVNVDQQKIAISARQTDTLGGIPFLQALQQGAFDGAIIQREKAFFSSWATTGGSLVPIGTAIMFKGRVAAIDDIGRTTAQITVAADTVFLDIDMPRRLWSPQCTHVLYDSGCGLARGTFSASGTVSGSSNLTTITWTGATSAYAQGVLVFTSGANEGVTATIKYADAGQLALAYPLPNVPAVGDAFTAAQGCDHTMATCLGKFRNLSNFRGYPYVPPPQVMTGPLSASWNQGQVWQSSPVAFTLAELGLALYDGSTPQAVWPYLAATYPSQALTYPGTAYCCAASWWLGASGGINSNNFEVYGILAGFGLQRNRRRPGLHTLRLPDQQPIWRRLSRGVDLLGFALQFGLRLPDLLQSGRDRVFAGAEQHGKGVLDPFALAAIEQFDGDLVGRDAQGHPLRRFVRHGKWRDLHAEHHAALQPAAPAVSIGSPQVGIYNNGGYTVVIETGGTLVGSFSTANAYLPYGLVLHQRQVSCSNGSVTGAGGDFSIMITALPSSGSCTVTLPSVNTAGTQLRVSDASGGAATHNIVITPASGNIDGSATYTISTNWGSWTGEWTGSIMKTVAKF